MSERRWQAHRWEAQALLEDGVTEGRVDGGALQLVTVRLRDGFGVCDELGEPLAPRPPVVSYLRPSEARALAFCLLELAELAERRSGAQW
jgi:hypothetical protein